MPVVFTKENQVVIMLVMGDEISKHVRKREDFEIERDRVIISELSMKGLSYPEIAEHLNNRPGIGYTISPQQVGYDKRKMLADLQAEQKENIEAWVTEEIFRLGMVEKEAWSAWQRSIGKVEDTKIVEALREIAKDEDGEPITDMVVERIERAIREQVGDRGYLETILKCINERGRLRGLHKLQVQVKQEMTHRVKTYQSWNPQKAWGGTVIDHEEVEQLEDGS